MDEVDWILIWMALLLYGIVGYSSVSMNNSSFFPWIYLRCMAIAQTVHEAYTYISVWFFLVFFITRSCCVLCEYDLIVIKFWCAVLDPFVFDNFIIYNDNLSWGDAFSHGDTYTSGYKREIVLIKSKDKSIGSHIDWHHSAEDNTNDHLHTSWFVARSSRLSSGIRF